MRPLAKVGWEGRAERMTLVRHSELYSWFFVTVVNFIHACSLAGPLTLSRFIKYIIAFRE